MGAISTRQTARAGSNRKSYAGNEKAELFGSVSRIGDSTCVKAVTRVNLEQGVAKPIVAPYTDPGTEFFYMTHEVRLRILAICGSLRTRSSNMAVIEAAKLLAPPPLEIQIFDGLAALPHYNPDLDADNPPQTVLTLRHAVGRADGLLICSPEYARGVAGVMKNGLDWLVASPEFPGKPVAVINASPRATHADAALRLTLATMSARLIEHASIALPILGRNLDAEAIAADRDLSSLMRQALEGMTYFLSTPTRKSENQ